MTRPTLQRLQVATTRFAALAAREPEPGPTDPEAPQSPIINGDIVTNDQFKTVRIGFAGGRFCSGALVTNAWGWGSSCARS